MDVTFVVNKTVITVITLHDFFLFSLSRLRVLFVVDGASIRATKQYIPVYWNRQCVFYGII